MGTIKTMKAIELVFDWNLWPRHSIGTLDSTNLAQLRDSLREGYEIPPVVVNKADYRLIDGFHRTRAMLDVFGPDTEISVILNDYKDDKEMFLESGRLNAFQGLKMSPTDRAHFAAKCKKMKIPMSVIADTLQINKSKFKEWYAKRTATSASTGETVVLKHASEWLAGKELTPEEEHYNNTETGMVFGAKVSVLINTLMSGYSLTEKNIKRLVELQGLIQIALDRSSYE